MTRAVARVYVVDDDASTRAALGRLLKSAGFQVKLFASGQDFLDYGINDPEAVLILDVRMPGLSGLDLQERLAARGGAPPIIFLTAFDDPQARGAALRKGAVAFLQKPVDEEVLFEAIKRACPDA